MISKYRQIEDMGIGSKVAATIGVNAAQYIRNYSHEMGHKIAALSLFKDSNAEAFISYLGDNYCTYNTSGGLTAVGALLGVDGSKALIAAAGWMGEALHGLIVLKCLHELTQRKPTEKMWDFACYYHIGLLMNNVLATAYSCSFMFSSESNLSNDSEAVYKYGGLYPILFMCLFNTGILAYHCHKFYSGDVNVSKLSESKTALDAGTFIAS
jgi:hypothetical protein